MEQTTTDTIAGPIPQYHAAKTTASQAVWYGLCSPKKGLSTLRNSNAQTAASVPKAYRITIAIVCGMEARRRIDLSEDIKRHHRAGPGALPKPNGYRTSKSNKRELNLV